MEKTLKVLGPGEITLVTIILLSNHTRTTRKDLPPLYKNQITVHLYQIIHQALVQLHGFTPMIK